MRVFIPPGCFARLLTTTNFFSKKLLTMPKTVAQCRKYRIPYLNTLGRTIPYLNTLTRTIPYLNKLTRTIIYLNTLTSAANQIRVSRHPSRQPIRIEYHGAEKKPKGSRLGWGPLLCFEEIIFWDYLRSFIEEIRTPVLSLPVELDTIIPK